MIATKASSPHALAILARTTISLYIYKNRKRVGDIFGVGKKTIMYTHPDQPRKDFGGFSGPNIVSEEVSESSPELEKVLGKAFRFPVTVEFGAGPLSPGTKRYVVEDGNWRFEH